MGKIPVGSSSDRQESSTTNQLTYGEDSGYLQDMLFREMFGDSYAGQPSYPQPPQPITPQPRPPDTGPGGGVGPGPGDGDGRGGGLPKPRSAGDPVIGAPPAAGGGPSGGAEGGIRTASATSVPTMTPQQAISYLNGLVDEARASGGATAYLPRYSTSNVSQNGIQSFGAHEFQGNRQIYAAQQIVDAALRGQPLSEQTAANLFRSAGVDPNQYLPGLQQAGVLGASGQQAPPPYAPPTPTVPPSYPPAGLPPPSGNGLAPITQEQFMSTQPGGQSQPVAPPPVPAGGLSSFAATQVASPLDPLRQVQTVDPRGGTVGLMGTSSPPQYPTPPPPGSAPGTPITGPARGRPDGYTYPTGHEMPTDPVGGYPPYAGPRESWQTGPGFESRVPPPYAPGSEVQNPNLPPGWPGGPPGIMPNNGIDPNSNPRGPVIPADPRQPPIVIPPRPPVPGQPPVGPPVEPPGPGGPPAVDLYAGGASGARQLTGQGVYDQLARMLHDPGYDQATRNAMATEGANAARATYAGAQGQIARRSAATGNSAGAVAGIAELGRAQAGTMGQQARQNQIDQFKESQRQREWATQGLGALYGGESSYLSNLFGQSGNLQGRLRQSRSQTKTRIDTPLISL